MYAEWMTEGLFDAKPTAFYDLYRLENGKPVEHWDVLEGIPPSDQWKNKNVNFEARHLRTSAPIRAYRNR